MKQTKVFEAEDGMTFATAAECKAHEELDWLAEFISRRLPSQIKDAILRNDLELADAFERAGAIIARKRRESGEVRRRKNKGTQGCVQSWSAGTLAAVMPAPKVSK